MNFQATNSRAKETLLRVFDQWTQVNNGEFTPQLLAAIQKSLAIANLERRLAPAYATVGSVRPGLGLVRNVEIEANVEITNFRGSLAVEHEITIQHEHPVVNDEPQPLGGIGNFLTRLVAIYQQATDHGVMDGNQKKFQFRFGHYTSLMYFVSSPAELRSALYDALLKYNEHVNYFGNETYGANDESHPPQRDDFLVEDGMSPEEILEGRRINEEVYMNALDRHNERVDTNIALRSEFLNQAVVKTVTATYMTYLGLRGSKIPKGLKLPPQISRSVIDPKNNDKHCFFHCLEVADVYFAKKYNSFCHYADVEKNPELEEWTVDVEDIEKFYNENGFKYSPATIKKIEDWYEYNINIYDLVENGDGFGIKCCYRSSSTADPTARVVRILYIPHNLMVVDKEVVRGVKKQKKLQHKYLHEDCDAGYSKKSAGHFVLLPDTSKLMNAAVEQDSKIWLCPYCDAPFRKNGEESQTFNLHKESCLNFITNKSNEERLCKFVDNMPNSSKEFTNYYQLTKQSWIVYADTETVTTDEDGQHQKHQVIAYMLNVV